MVTLIAVRHASSAISIRFRLRLHPGATKVPPVSTSPFARRGTLHLDDCSPRGGGVDDVYDKLSILTGARRW